MCQDAAASRTTSTAHPAQSTETARGIARIGARVVSPHMDGAHAAESREKWVRWAAEVNEAAKH